MSVSLVARTTSSTDKKHERRPLQRREAALELASRAQKVSRKRKYPMTFSTSPTA